MSGAVGTIDALAAELVVSFGRRGVVVATAESCTGGLIAASITDVPGSSAVLDRGFVTYSNAAKMEMLGVEEETLMKHGAVSREVAAQMAEGALATSHADVAVAVTGIAGPDGGSAGKPVGLVHFARAGRSGPTRSEHHVFSGDRAAIRRATVRRALELLMEVTA